ncbi:MAG: hypothetical protein HDT42_11645 [Ruminococcaceae bacterium]|nr:hypothetical protein [Oscillospiraceae bacterium]
MQIRNASGAAYAQRVPCCKSSLARFNASTDEIRKADFICAFSDLPLKSQIQNASGALHRFTV